MIERNDSDGIAILKLSHGKANTMDVELCQAVIDAFCSLRTSSAKAVVLTGQGGMFSAGVDLIRTSAGGPEYVRKFLPVLNAMFDAVFHFPRPVIAAVNGHAVAGGCVLACCADHRIMAQGNGRIGITELLVGLPFPALAFEVMRLATAPRFFPQAVYGGETHLSDGGLERGWIHEIVQPAELNDKALAVARKLAALPPVTFSTTKRQIHADALARMERDGAATDAAVIDIWASPEAQARIRDYVARTLKK